MTRGALPAIRTAQDFGAAFNVSRETLERLETYERLLRQWQKAVNLVAPSTLEDVWHRHFADSAQLLPLPPAAAVTWADLGSGGGFPGLVVAILLADSPSPRLPAGSQRTGPTHGAPLGTRGEGRVEGQMQSPEQAAAHHPSPLPMPEGAWGEGSRVTLIESNARKAAFLREVVRQTGTGGRIAVDILSTRIETTATQASLPRQDVVSARALAPLDRLLGLAAPLFAPTTVGVFMKGREAAEEIKAAERMWNFNVELIPSRTERDGQIVLIRQPELKSKPKNEGK